ncbi:hypothetical protein HOC37_02005 [bacterium]|nr:hypothetical protein [bacterium]MBT4551742.1 hypothetical protein [bacterium]
MAIFIFLTHYAPNTTGFLGFWVVSVWGKKLFGRAVVYLPLFLGCFSLGMLFYEFRRRWASVLICLWALFLSLVVLLEMYKSSLFLKPGLVIQSKGGGVVGGFLWKSLESLVGKSGVLLFLSGVFLISLIFIFETSFVRMLVNLFKTNVGKPVKESDKEDVVAQKEDAVSWWQKFIYLFFYTKRSDKLRMKKRANKVNKRKSQKSKQTDEKKVALKPNKSEVVASNEGYVLPDISLLDESNSEFFKGKVNVQERKEVSILLEETFASFNVDAKVINVTTGPSVTRYELQPGVGVKIAKIVNLTKDIALKLAVPHIRIEAPIPGKALVGIEVPNQNIKTVTLRDIMEKTNFWDRKSKLVCALGLTITGEPVLMDIAKLPHVLIAGATGSGKSVCVNSIILSILFRATPDEVKFLMIDPKKVELSIYNNIPHLLAPVVTDPHKAAATLKQWALLEMERRYEAFSQQGVKNIEAYNLKIAELLQKKRNKTKKELKDPAFLEEVEKQENEELKPLPYILVIIDELADLMMVASQEVENTICRLAQMARATGIHLIISTQRPSVNVITGLIKANIPSRISFYLQSQIDSRTILDMPGAEKLLGKGDMLYSPVGAFKPKRLQGVFMSEKEVSNVVDFLKRRAKPKYVEEIIQMEPIKGDEGGSGSSSNKQSDDDLFEEAKNIVMNTRYASTSYLQRKLRIGYNRAARIMDELEEKGIISQYAGEKRPREVL